MCERQPWRAADVERDEQQAGEAPQQRVHAQLADRGAQRIALRAGVGRAAGLEPALDRQVQLEAPGDAGGHAEEQVEREGDQVLAARGIRVRQRRDRQDRAHEDEDDDPADDVRHRHPADQPRAQPGDQVPRVLRHARRRYPNRQLSAATSLSSLPGRR
jgi:hypothetical protein